MLKDFSLRLAFGAITVATLFLNAGALVAQEAQCPYADDAVILYDSPSTLAKSGCAMNDKFGFQEELSVLNKLFDKADREILKAKEKGKINDDVKFPTKQYDYLAKLLSDATGQDSFVRSVLVAYFKYVDGVVVAFELPESLDEIKTKGPEGLSLTLIFNEDPSALHPKNFFGESDDLEMIKEGDGMALGKFRVRDNGEVKATVYFGGTKIKDVQKYAIVFGSRSIVEKKIDRFQNTNAFITSRLANERLVSDRIVKPAVFETICKAIDNDENLKNDERVKVVRGVVEKIVSVQNQVFADENGFEKSLVVETSNEETAQTFVDLATGGIAAVKLAGSQNENLTAEQKIGLDILKSVTVERDGASFKGKGKVGVEQLKAFFKLIKEKCDN